MLKLRCANLEDRRLKPCRLKMGEFASLALHALLSSLPVAKVRQNDFWLQTRDRVVDSQKALGSELASLPMLVLTTSCCGGPLTLRHLETH